MTQYLLSIYQPEGEAPSETLDVVMPRIHALNEALQAAGAWVFTGGLYDPSTATVVRVHADEVLLTDGPFLEGKEHIGGIYVITVADLDAALQWARKLSDATTLPIEVRPFQGADEVE